MVLYIVNRWQEFITTNRVPNWIPTQPPPQLWVVVAEAVIVEASIGVQELRVEEEVPVVFALAAGGRVEVFVHVAHWAEGIVAVAFDDIAAGVDNRHRVEVVFEHEVARAQAAATAAAHHVPTPEHSPDVIAFHCGAVLGLRVNLAADQPVAGQFRARGLAHAVIPLRHLFAGAAVFALQMREQAVVGVFVAGSAIYVRRG